MLSLFDGIGGVWAALKRMEIPFVGYSCEVVSSLHSPPLAFAMEILVCTLGVESQCRHVCVQINFQRVKFEQRVFLNFLQSAPAVEVVKARYPKVKHLGDVSKLERSAIRGEVDLLVGGFPCQDLSCMGKREGYVLHTLPIYPSHVTRNSSLSQCAVGNWN